MTQRNEPHKRSQYANRSEAHQSTASQSSSSHYVYNAHHELGQEGYEHQQYNARTSRYSENHNGHTTHTRSYTPRVGEATMSGEMPRTEHRQPTQRSRTPHAHGSSTAGRTTPTRRTANNQNKDAHTSQRTNAARSFNTGRYSSNRSTAKKPMAPWKKRTVLTVVIVVAVIAICAFSFYSYENTKPVTVTINGEEQTIEGDQRTIAGLINTETVSVTPGNFVAVDGSAITEGEGTLATATINDETQEDLSARLDEGDVITITDGEDIMEEYTESDPQPIEPTYEIDGVGAVHLYTSIGQEGEKVVRTGNTSGKTAEITTEEPVNGTVQCYNVDTNGDKVIALTFDDGPWDTYTEEILDILEDNGAKATFFTVGERISGHEDLVQRAAEAGHQISTHTYDHAEGSGEGVSLILMSTDERQEEVTKGLQSIEDATGSEASTIFRSPGGNFDNDVATDLAGIVTAEIGWNIDTGDWQKPGADVIAERIESADPGEIILMHDGGGDRSQTVKALKEALPALKKQGYRFITVEELIENYPYSS